MTRRGWILLAVAIAALLVGIGGTLLVIRLGSSSMTTMHGTLHLRGSEHMVGSNLSPCHGAGDYEDVHEGTKVVVTDASGATIATTSLGHGVLDTPRVGPNDCVFLFDVAVPAGKGFYGVEVAHHGRVQFAESDLRRLALTLGL